MSITPTVLDIDEPFDPLYGAPIVIPQDHVFYRGYDVRFSSISDRPSHYSVKHVAAAYAAKPHSTLGCFTNSRALLLLDFRYMCVLLTQMFSNRVDNTFPSINPIVRISVGYGLCDICEQLDLGTRMFPTSLGIEHLKTYYNNHIKHTDYQGRPIDVNPLSPSGFRIAETQNDGFILTFVKDIFGDMVDGFIAPRLKTPYHYEKNGTMSPEIVLFSPQKAGVRQIPGDPTLPTTKITDVMQLRSSRQELRCSLACMTAAMRKPLMYGGDGSSAELEAMDASDAFFQLVDEKDKGAVKLMKESKAAAKKWRKKFQYTNYFAPHPNSPVSPWNGTGYSGI